MKTLTLDLTEQIGPRLQAVLDAGVLGIEA